MPQFRSADTSRLEKSISLGRVRHLERLIAAFNPLEGRAIIVPTRRGKRGNPVLWSKRFFAGMAGLAGDVGAKHLIGEHAELVAEVEMDDDAVLVDIDTPEALETLRRKAPHPSPLPARRGEGGTREAGEPAADLIRG